MHLSGDQSVIGTSSLRHEEHHILALKVGETSLIRVPGRNVPMQTHTCNQELFFWNLAHPHTLLNPTHPTVSQPSLSLTSLCVCEGERVFKYRAGSERVIYIISTFGILFSSKD